MICSYYFLQTQWPERLVGSPGRIIQTMSFIILIRNEKLQLQLSFMCAQACHLGNA